MQLSRSRIVLLATAVFVLGTFLTAAGSAGQTVPPPPPLPQPQPREVPPEIKAYSEARAITDPQKKLEALQKIAADFGNSSMISSINRSILETMVENWPQKTGEIAAAADKAMKSIESAPDSVRASFCISIAEILSKSGTLLDTAEQLINKGIKLLEEDNAKRLRTTRASYTAALGNVYLKQGKTAEAEKSFKEAYDANPSLSTAALGLAEVAEKAGNNTAALEYLTSAALSGRLPADGRKRLETAYAKTHGGSVDGLNAMLDSKYRTMYPLQVKVESYKSTGARSNRVVLAEVFTGSGCPPCVAADLGFDAAMQRYSRSDLAVLMYHLHIPLPDPMTNPSTDKRADFYKVRSVPTYLIDGVQDGGGGSREMTSQFFERIRPKIDKRLEAASDAELKLEASLDQNMLKVKANVNNIKATAGKLKLQIALVEDELSFSGENGVRFHPMVVRSLAGEKAEGFALDPSKLQPVEHVFDLTKISGELKAALDGLEERSAGGKMKFAEKKHQINPEHLSVIVFVQNEENKSILQSIQVKVKSASVASSR